MDPLSMIIMAIQAAGSLAAQGAGAVGSALGSAGSAIGSGASALGNAAGSAAGAAGNAAGWAKDAMASDAAQTGMKSIQFMNDLNNASESEDQPGALYSMYNKYAPPQQASAESESPNPNRINFSDYEVPESSDNYLVNQLIDSDMKRNRRRRY